MSSPADFTAQGLLVGHASDNQGATGVTVIRGATGAFRASATVVGRASSTRQFDAMSPNHLVQRVDAIVLSGGSAFGLDCASGAMRWMEERGRGFQVGNIVVPIIPAAVVFDLGPLGRFDARPSPDMAYAACENAVASGIAEGSVGAGTGATVGKGAGIERCMKGGVGVATLSTDRFSVSALAVVNAFGNVLDAQGRVIAGARDDNGGFVDLRRAIADGSSQSRFRSAASMNTTLAVVAASVPLGRAELHQVAVASSAALHRRIVPAGTTVDGDVIFAVSPLDGEPGNAAAVEALASMVLELAIERAVLTAHGTAAVPAVNQFRGVAGDA